MQQVTFTERDGAWWVSRTGIERGPFETFTEAAQDTHIEMTMERIRPARQQDEPSEPAEVSNQDPPGTPAWVREEMSARGISPFKAGGAPASTSPDYSTLGRFTR